jgi:hypothetical protein
VHDFHVLSGSNTHNGANANANPNNDANAGVKEH